MKKTYYFLLLAGLLAMLILSGCSSKGISGKEDEVRISIYGQVTPADAVISKEKDTLLVDPRKVTSLFISTPANSDLESLKYFVNLKYLRIDNFIVKGKYDTYDLSPLKDLPLVGLSVAGFDADRPISIKSLEPIGNIKSLAILDLENCQITSVKDLAGLTGLSRLLIRDGNDIKIEDLSSLSSLTNLGENSETIEESKEWKFGPYSLTGDEPLLGLLISNGNSEAEIEEVRTAILSNLNGYGQASSKEDEPDNTPEETTKEGESDNMPEETIKKEDKADLYYFKEYGTFKIAENGEALESIFLEAFDNMGRPLWDYSWENLRPTELSVDSETVVYDGKIYKAVTGTLYCLEGTSGKILWENDNDVGGGTVIYPYKDRIYLTSYYGNILACLDKDTGAKIWAIEDQDLYWGHAIFSRNDEIIVAYGDGWNFLSAHYQDGQILNQWYGDRSELPDENIGWDRASASSVLEENLARYGAMNTIDNNSQTAWAEGAEGYGIDEWIQIERDGLVDIYGILIENGYHKSGETYYNNGKLKKFRLDFSQDRYIYYEVDENKTDPYYIRLFFDRPVSTDFIRLTILDVFEGSKYEDTCITDIVAY